jgi:hypothetical protein
VKPVELFGKLLSELEIEDIQPEPPLRNGNTVAESDEDKKKLFA